MYSTNEYSRLRKIIVGDATGSKVPNIDISARCVNYSDKLTEAEIPNAGPYPTQVIDEANEDIAILIDFLEKQNVSVYRPDSDFEPAYSKFCPRDTIFVHGKNSLFAPMAIRSRQQECEAYKKILVDTKQMKINRNDPLYNESCVGNKNILALHENEPCFDAANILKDNNHVYYLVSNSGNATGADALQNILGQTAKVEKIEGVYSYMHLDSTLAFLREGLLLVNPSRVKDKSQLPSSLQKHDIIYAPEPVDIGYYENYCNSSVWINVNLLSIDEKLVVLEENQHNLRKILEQQGIECAMLPMRHARTLGGCFHCVTLDLERDNV
tara:strand:- start:198 stop:1172 length:975 start_codon:yes stop_codon:yes gene_type:complete